MKRSVDDAVDRVLAGLRETELPEGLEQRILGEVQARSAAKVHTRVALKWLWAPATVMVVAAVFVPLLRRPQSSGIPVAGTRAPTSKANTVTQKSPERLPVPQVQARVAARKPKRPEVAMATASRSNRLSESDLRALEEMHAPSRPAVPEPLTAQERRLLDIAVHGTAEQRAALNPVVQEEQYEEAKAAAMEFFEPKVKADTQE